MNGLKSDAARRAFDAKWNAMVGGDRAPSPAKIEAFKKYVEAMEKRGGGSLTKGLEAEAAKLPAGKTIPEPKANPYPDNWDKFDGTNDEVFKERLERFHGTDDLDNSYRGGEGRVYPDESRTKALKRWFKERIKDLATSVNKLCTIDTMLTFVDVDGGALALTHRPKLRDLPALRAAGATHVVTLLAANEQAEQLGKAVAAAGLGWIWVPMVGAGVPDAERTAVLRGELDKLRDLIADGARLVVHCSAGIHRTGMFGYALLRRLGLSPGEAREKLRALRAVTAEGVGDDRLAWGDGLGRP